MNVEQNQLNKELQINVDKLLNQFVCCLSSVVKDAMNDSLTGIIDKLDIVSSKPDKQNIQSEYITRKEALEYLNISPPTLYRHQRDKLIPYYKIGRKIYFKKDELLNSREGLSYKNHNKKGQK